MVTPNPDPNPNPNPTSSGIKLNDTGITACANDYKNGLACPVTGYPGQDAELGRDATHNDDSDGHAGFSFTKIDHSGQALASSASAWDCVKDNVTGLIWENKTSNGGLRDLDATYSWYEPDNSKNGGYAGRQNAGSCSGSACDTYSNVKAVNAQGLCGARDWRMPTRNELLSIVDNSTFDPAIDADYFPTTSSGGYWSSSSSPDAYFSSYAWYVSFSDGSVVNNGGYKTNGYRVRLARGGQ